MRVTMAMLTLMVRHGIHYDMLLECVRTSVKNINSASGVQKLVAEMRDPHKQARLHSVNPGVGHMKQRLIAESSERSCQWKGL